ncbi:MAG: OmpA family protein [Gammaproteobacteria bacterium]|nr:OmpA family protein [Gammaproteobacteria bacterium]
MTTYFLRSPRLLFSVLIYLSAIPYAAMALPVVSEKIIFLNEDGKNYVRYDTSRTNHPSYSIWFEKDESSSPEDHLKDYLYIYPNQYKWDTTSQPGYDLLKIASGNYATLVQEKLDRNNEITIGEDGVYTYTNWDNKTRTPENHYGIWNKPENFSQLVYAWVFPQNFNIISYHSNRKGNWVKRNNTITYYGNNVNDLVFTIKYQPRTNLMYRELVKTLNELEQIKLEQDTKGVKITLAATVLFSSGSSELSHRGKSILARLSSALRNQNDTRIIIEGHTDNIDIRGKLERKYKTNWELSAARSLNVLHYLAENKISETRLEARSHGAQRPVASNDTRQGRARNRRIEIMIKNIPQ